MMGIYHYGHVMLYYNGQPQIETSQFYQNKIPVFDKTNTSLLLQNAFENVFFKVNFVVKLT